MLCHGFYNFMNKILTFFLRISLLLTKDFPFKCCTVATYKVLVTVHTIWLCIISGLNFAGGVFSWEQPSLHCEII